MKCRRELRRTPYPRHHRERPSILVASGRAPRGCEAAEPRPATAHPSPSNTPTPRAAQPPRRGARWPRHPRPESAAPNRRRPQPRPRRGRADLRRTRSAREAGGSRSASNTWARFRSSRGTCRARHREFVNCVSPVSRRSMANSSPRAAVSSALAAPRPVDRTPSGNTGDAASSSDGGSGGPTGV